MNITSLDMLFKSIGSNSQSGLKNMTGRTDRSSDTTENSSNGSSTSSSSGFGGLMESLGRLGTRLSASQTEKSGSSTTTHANKTEMVEEDQDTKESMSVRERRLDRKDKSHTAETTMAEVEADTSISDTAEETDAVDEKKDQADLSQMATEAQTPLTVELKSLKCDGDKFSLEIKVEGLGDVEISGAMGDLSKLLSSLEKFLKGNGDGTDANKLDVANLLVTEGTGQGSQVMSLEALQSMLAAKTANATAATDVTTAGKSDKLSVLLAKEVAADAEPKAHLSKSDEKISVAELLDRLKNQSDTSPQDTLGSMIDRSAERKMPTICSRPSRQTTMRV